MKEKNRKQLDEIHNESDTFSGKIGQEIVSEVTNRFIGAGINMDDYSSQIVEDIKWFMFDDESKEIKNENGFSHRLQFVSWTGDGQSFIVKDLEGMEYRIHVSKEE